MTDRRLTESPDAIARSIAMWTKAVEASATAVGLVELGTARFLALSPAGAELLGTTVEAGVGMRFLDVIDAPEAAGQAFRLMHDGIIDAAQTRRRLTRPDASTVDVRSGGWAVRLARGPRIAVWAACDASNRSCTISSGDLVAGTYSYLPFDHHDRLNVDADWRVTDIGVGSAELLGWSPGALVGTSFLDVIHPYDLGVFLVALARSTADRSTRLLVRLRDAGGGWQLAYAEPSTMDDDGSPSVAVLLSWSAAAASKPGGAPDVPAQLRRIADQIESAGALAPLTAASAALGLTAAPDLTPRQWEIVSRLVQGERVSTIAAAIYVSPSTVRNHLSAVFAKVGVHSQEELISRYRKPATLLPAE